MKRGFRAFTLIELLVSAAIVAAILVLMSSILGSVISIWSAGNQRADLAQTARAVVELIGRELSFAQALPAGMQGNFRSYASYPLVVNPPLAGYSDAVRDSDGVPMDSLFFYSPLSPSSGGALSCVGYFTSGDHSLKRLGVGSASSYSMAADQLQVYWMWNTTPHGGIPGRAQKASEFILPCGWLNPASGNGFSNAVADGSVTSVVAERVLGFLVRPIGRDGSPLPSDQLPSTAPSSTAGTAISRAYNSSWWPVADSLPAQIEVTLVVCEVKAYARLREENRLPILSVPKNNSDDAFKNALSDFQDRLNRDVDQSVIVTRRFSILRGSR